jgi:hypothetical protein
MIRTVKPLPLASAWALSFRQFLFRHQTSLTCWYRSVLFRLNHFIGDYMTIRLFNTPLAYLANMDDLCIWTSTVK